MARGKLLKILLSLTLCAQFLQAQSSVLITEIHYHPLDTIVAGIEIDGDLFEFLELKNVTNQQIDISGYTFTAGLTYTFKSGVTIPPKGFIVLASDSAWFNKRYGFQPFDQYIGKLSNSGESITLCDSKGARADNVTYKDKDPWPYAADGAGNSLSASDPDRAGDPDNYSTWKASSEINGSPNKDDPVSTSPRILINEVLSCPNDDQSKFIELYNADAAEVSIGGWYLTDNRNKPKKFKIPEGTKIPGKGYLVFTEDQFNSTNLGSNSFGINRHGEDVFIFEADQNDNLTGYNHGYGFGEIEIGKSFGNYTNSAGVTHFVAQASPTPGAENSEPLVGAVVITEIMYDGDDGVEYLEIQNTGNETVPLFDTENTSNTWKVSGIGFNFPSQTKIEPGQIVLLIDDIITVDAFRTKFNLSKDILIFSYTGTLQGGSETIRLEKPAFPYFQDDTLEVVPYIVTDWVEYDNKGGWPDDARGSRSLHRKNVKTYGNDPANWKSGTASPGSFSTPVLQEVRRSKQDLQFAIRENKISNTFSFSIYLPASKLTTVDLFDCQGRLQMRLLHEQLGSGLHVRDIPMASLKGSKMLILKASVDGVGSYAEKLMIIN